MKLSQSFAVDVIAAVVYLVAANPALTGLAIHEWASLGILVVLIVHVAQHYDWVIDAFKRTRRNPSLATTGNLVLDVVTVVVLMVVTVSGIMISRHILPALGLVAQGYFFWNPLHSLFAKVLLALLMVHVVVHAKWLWAFFRSLRQGKGASDDSSEKK
ncbi:MAG: DUF4405 domain-containing protein [Coriobacteriales bacterium]|jgi:hypothetical protein|nr:DUF4405 domain-containing protein [Coriobacteriales bacterium]